jgi:hypothetical protein
MHNTLVDMPTFDTAAVNNGHAVEFARLVARKNVTVQPLEPIEWPVFAIEHCIGPLNVH